MSLFTPFSPTSPGPIGETTPATGAFTVLTASTSLGYKTGAGVGGTVIQLTSKGTGVTLNKITGQITMNAAALAANTTISFALTNSTIATNDLIVLNHVANGTTGAYTLNANTPAVGSVNIDVRNVTGGSLSENIIIGFAVIKAAIS